MDFIDAYLDETLASFSAFCASAEHRKVMEDMAELLTERFREGRKLLVCGNGGSAADAQHIACEFVSRFLFDRAPLPAIALTTDSSILTAIGNDYGYQHSFERQVLALGQEGDVLLGISTSGNSPNVLAAFTAAKSKGITCLGFTGAANNQMSSCCDMLLAAPSTKTPIIQQIHITAAHVVCALVERDMFPQG